MPVGSCHADSTTPARRALPREVRRRSKRLSHLDRLNKQQRLRPAPQRTWPNRTCASGRVASFRATTHPGRELDHKRCQTPLCVNSEHLEEVTHRRNVLRGDSPAATRHRNQRCGRGHPMTAEHGRRATNGRWYCNTCRREQRQTSAVAVPPPGFYDPVQVRAWARQAVSPRLLLVSRAKRYPLWRVVPTGQ